MERDPELGADAEVLDESQPGGLQARFLSGTGQDYTLEAIGLLLTLTFIVRIFGDIINRVRSSGRSLGRSDLHHEGLDDVWRRVVSVVTSDDHPNPRSDERR